MGEDAGDQGLCQLGGQGEQPRASCCEGCPADPAHLAHGPRLLFQVQLKADWADYRKPYDLHVLVYYLLGDFSL